MARKWTRLSLFQWNWMIGLGEMEVTQHPLVSMSPPDLEPSSSPHAELHQPLQPAQPEWTKASGLHKDSLYNPTHPAIPSSIYTSCIFQPFICSSSCHPFYLPFLLSFYRASTIRP